MSTKKLLARQVSLNRKSKYSFIYEDSEGNIYQPGYYNDQYQPKVGDIGYMLKILPDRVAEWRYEIYPFKWTEKHHYFGTFKCKDIHKWFGQQRRCLIKVSY